MRFTFQLPLLYIISLKVHVVSLVKMHKLGCCQVGWILRCEGGSQVDTIVIYFFKTNLGIVKVFISQE